MVMEDIYHSQLQSLVLVEAEEPPLLQETSVLVVAKYMVIMVAQLRILFVLVVTRKDILRQSVTLEKHSHVYVLHTKTRLSRKYTPMKTRTLVNQRMST